MQTMQPMLKCFLWDECRQSNAEILRQASATPVTLFNLCAKITHAPPSHHRNASGGVTGGGPKGVQGSTTPSAFAEMNASGNVMGTGTPPGSQRPCTLGGVSGMLSSSILRRCWWSRRETIQKTNVRKPGQWERIKPAGSGRCSFDSSRIQLHGFHHSWPMRFLSYIWRKTCSLLETHDGQVRSRFGNSNGNSPAGLVNINRGARWCRSSLQHIDEAATASSTSVCRIFKQ